MRLIKFCMFACCNILDALLMIIACVLTLILLGQTDKETREICQKIIAELASWNLQSSHSEEFLILSKRCTFLTHSFGFFNITYATLNKVIHEISETSFY